MLYRVSLPGLSLTSSSRMLSLIRNHHLVLLRLEFQLLLLQLLLLLLLSPGRPSPP